MRTYMENLRQNESFQQLAEEFGTLDINKIAELWLKKYDGDYYSCKSPKKSRTLEYPYETETMSKRRLLFEKPLSNLNHKQNLSVKKFIDVSL